MPSTYTPLDLMCVVAQERLAETRLVETPLLGLLSDSTVLQQQRAIQWPARLADAEIGGRTLTGATTSDTSGALGKAEIAIPDYYFKYQFQVIRRDIVEAAAVGKVQIVRDAVGAEINDALRSFTQEINKTLYTGVGTLNDSSYGVLGLNEIVKQTGTYAGISRATYPRWKSAVSTGSTAGTDEELSVSRVTQLLRTRRKAGASYARNNGATLIALTSDEIETDVLREMYKGDAQPQGMYGEMFASIAPYATYAIRGIPVVSDVVDAVSNKIYVVDPSKLSLHCFNDNTSVAMYDEKISFFTYNGLQFRMAEVGDRHPDVIDLELSVSLQLKCHDPIQGVSVLEDVSDTYSA